MLLPSLSTVFGIGALAALAVAGVQTVRMDHAKSELAGEKLAFANFKTDIAEKNLKLVNEQRDREAAAFDKLTSAMKTLGEIGKQTTTEVRLVQSNGGACLQDPAYLAMFDGLARVQLAAQGSPRGNESARGPQAKATMRATGAPVPLHVR